MALDGLGRLQGWECAGYSRRMCVVYKGKEANEWSGCIDESEGERVTGSGNLVRV